MRKRRVLFLVLGLALCALVLTACAGQPGAQGSSGSQGPQGTQGDPGPQGPSGRQGPQGVIGLTGASGSEGPAGPRGSSGAKGDKGDKGDPGPAGPAGARGPSGAAGSGGAAVAPAAVAEYVGTQACADCHEGKVASFVKSGHGYKLNKVVDGKPPEYPFSEVPNPPEGYTWDEITYVIGGFGWKARFIGEDGFIITGDENGKTQYNLRNERLDLGDNWVGYHPGEKRAYNCGPCHTTGYRPEGHQDGLEGLVGTWAEDGVECEACHGPASQHVDAPYDYGLEVDNSAEACGRCHSRGAVESLNASGGFVRHHEQYESFFQSKHRALDCTDCHDPHTAVKYAEEAGESGIRIDCQNCHFGEAENQAVGTHKALGVECKTCHMPYLTKSAVADADSKQGDLRVHLFAINPDAESQFTEDGGAALPYITLDTACGQCHSEAGMATVKPPELLKEKAIGYHERG